MREAYSDPPKLCGKLYAEVTSVLKPLHIEVQSELHVMPTFDEGSGDLASGLLACARVGPSDVPRHLLRVPEGDDQDRGGVLPEKSAEFRGANMRAAVQGAVGRWLLQDSADLLVRKPRGCVSCREMESYLQLVINASSEIEQVEA